MSPARPHTTDDQLFTPREVAQIFGVRTTTLARWAREGKLPNEVTPGGHRRYRRKAVQALLDDQEAGTAPTSREPWESDAVRLYEQGWSIRQVAARFERSYGQMRRILLRNTTLRSP